jgi:hypothetical protein
MRVEAYPADEAVVRAETGAAGEVLARALAALRDREEEPAPGRLRLPDDLRGFAPELWAPLAVVAGVGRRPPREQRAARLAHALARISAWAEDRGAYRTALAFAAASAERHPLLSSPALLAGRMARLAALHRDAERWLNEALERATRTGDTPTRVEAARELIQLGREAAVVPARFR